MDKRIAIDLDGVIYNIIDAIIIKLRNEFDIKLQPENIIYYNLSELIPSITKEQENEFFLDWKMYTAKKIIPFSDRALRLLKDNDWNITILTGRNFDKLLYITTEYLRDMNLVYDRLVFMSSKDKTKFMKEEEINYLVEDRGKTVLEAANEGITSFLIDAPYNQGVEHKNIFRMKNLYEVVEHLGTYYFVNMGEING